MNQSAEREFDALWLADQKGHQINELAADDQPQYTTSMAVDNTTKVFTVMIDMTLSGHGDESRPAYDVQPHVDLVRIRQRNGAAPLFQAELSIRLRQEHPGGGRKERGYGAPSSTALSESASTCIHAGAPAAPTAPP